MTPEQIAQRIYLLEQQKKEIETEISDLKDNFRTLEVGTKEALGPFQVSVQRNARFDPTLAAKVLTPTQYASILSTVPDSKKAKEVLPPKDYHRAQKESAPKIVVTLPKED